MTSPPNNTPTANKHVRDPRAPTLRSIALNSPQTYIHFVYRARHGGRAPPVKPAQGEKRSKDGREEKK